MNGQLRTGDLKGAASVRMTVTAVSKAFQGHAAIEDVSFMVAAGEFVAVLGPSGAGKTTLFRCMTGLVRPTTAQCASTATTSPPSAAATGGGSRSCSSSSISSAG